MNYLAISKRTGAATTRRMTNTNPCAIYYQIRDNDPTASDAIIRKKWIAALRNNPDTQDAVNEYARSNFEHLWQKDRIKQRKYSQRKTAEDVEKERALLREIVSDIKKITLMDMVMPNGKQLKDCKFKEVSAFGSWFKLLATRGKPSEKIGDKLTEKDLQELK